MKYEFSRKDIVCLVIARVSSRHSDKGFEVGPSSVMARTY